LCACVASARACPTCPRTCPNLPEPARTALPNLAVLNQAAPLRGAGVGASARPPALGRPRPTRADPTPQTAIDRTWLIRPHDECCTRPSPRQRLSRSQPPRLGRSLRSRRMRSASPNLDRHPVAWGSAATRERTVGASAIAFLVSFPEGHRHGLADHPRGPSRAQYAMRSDCSNSDGSPSGCRWRYFGMAVVIGQGRDHAC
jgi:hypothetical protein